MSELPEGWVLSSLGLVGNWASGGTPSRKNAEYFGEGVPWIKSGDLPDGPVLRTEEQITELGLKNSSAKLMPEGTISMAMYGATIGKLGILTFPAATNQACANVIPESKLIDRDYLYFYLLSERKALIDKGQGGAQPNISQEVIKAHPILIAPLAEQRRIVAKLETLLGKVDACQQRLAKIPVLLKRFRQAVLAAACSGELTVDWRTRHSTLSRPETILDSLCQSRIAKARSEAERAKIKAIYEYTEEKVPDVLPEQWRFVALGKLCESFDYGTSAKSQPVGDVPVLRMGNIQNREIDWNDLVYSSDPEEIRKYSLKPMTVLFNRTNSPELVGKTAIYRGERPSIFAGYLIRINPCDILDPAYLNYCLNTNDAKEFCQMVKSDGVSQSNINAQKLRTFEVPFCSIEEQQEIVRRVEALFQLADQLEARYQRAKAQVDKLPQAILAKAFRGELVPTEAELARQAGRSYESAAELLARIQAARPQSATKPKRKAQTKRHP